MDIFLFIRCIFDVGYDIWWASPVHFVLDSHYTGSRKRDINGYCTCVSYILVEKILSRQILCTLEE